MPTGTRLKPGGPFLVRPPAAVQSTTAPAFIGVTAVPADNGAQAGPTVIVDKDAGALSSAIAGDLVVVVVQYKALADTGTNGQVLPDEYGGQNWNIERGATGSGHHSRIIWCRFNGAWTADPTFSHFVTGAASGVLALTAVAMVFRPDNPADHWVVCNGVLRGTFVAGVGPFTKTITGLTPRKNDTVTVAIWSTPDANTWDTLAGTNWTQNGLSAQYRNTTGTDTSLAIAYQLQGTAAPTNNVSLNQATLGGDAGLTQICSFAAITMPTGSNVATVASVQAARTFDAAGGETSIVVLGAAVTSQNAVVVNWNHETVSGAEVVSILDNQSNEYVQLGRYNDMIFEQTKLIAWRPAVTNGPTTITATLSVLEIFRHIYAREVAGLGEFDQAVGYVSLCADQFALWNPFTPSRTPSVSGCFLSGQAFMVGGATTHDCLNDADGWTLGFGGIDGVPDEPNVEHYQIQTTATAEDYDIDVPTTVGATAIAMGWAAFRPAVAAGGTHATTGALVADAAIVAGTAVHLTLHATTGALAAQSATVTGTAAAEFAATGALVAGSAVVAGAAEHVAPSAHDAAGDLVAGAAQVAGSATLLPLPAPAQSGQDGASYPRDQRGKKRRRQVIDDEPQTEQPTTTPAEPAEPFAPNHAPQTAPATADAPKADRLREMLDRLEQFRASAERQERARARAALALQNRLSLLERQQQDAEMAEITAEALADDDAVAIAAAFFLFDS